MSAAKPKQEATKAAKMTAAEEAKYRKKYRELKKRILEVEEDNDRLTVKLTRSRKNITRLRVERSFLFEKLESVQQGNEAGGKNDGATAASTTTTNDDYGTTNATANSSATATTRSGFGGESSGFVGGGEFRMDYGFSSADESGPVTVTREGPPPPETPNATTTKGSKSTGKSTSKSTKKASTGTDATGGDPKPLDPAAEAAKRAKADPNAPKRPANPFFVFSNLERTGLKELHPDATLSEVTIMLGHQWQAMSKEEKQKYNDLYEKDKVRYKDEMDAYIAADIAERAAAGNNANASAGANSNSGSGAGGAGDEEEEEMVFMDDDHDGEENPHDRTGPGTAKRKSDASANSRTGSANKSLKSTNDALPSSASSSRTPFDPFPSSSASGARHPLDLIPSPPPPST